MGLLTSNKNNHIKQKEAEHRTSNRLKTNVDAVATEAGNGSYNVVQSTATTSLQ